MKELPRKLWCIEAAHKHVDGTVHVALHADDMSDEDLIKQLRFMAFSAGFDVGFEKAKAEIISRYHEPEKYPEFDDDAIRNVGELDGES